MTFNKELESAADYLWNRAIEIYKSDETHGAWTLEIANYTNQLIKELRGVAAIKPIGDTGREQPSEIAQCRFCKQMGCQGQCLVTPANIMHRAFDFTPPKYDKVAQEGFAKLDELASGVAPAQAQPESAEDYVGKREGFWLVQCSDPQDVAEVWWEFHYSKTVRDQPATEEEVALWHCVKDLLRASDPQKGQGWVSVEDGLPKVGQWCWVVYHGAVQRMAAHLAGKGFACADGYEWRWADEEADPAPVEEISHWQPLPPPPSVPAGGDK